MPRRPCCAAAPQHTAPLAAPQGHGDTINGIAWSPDGTLLATACDDMMLRLFDLHDLAVKVRTCVCVCVCLRVRVRVCLEVRVARGTHVCRTGRMFG
jgi:hypothetical protein